MEKHLPVLDQSFNSLKGYVTILSKPWTSARVGFYTQPCSSSSLSAPDSSAPTASPMSSHTSISVQSELNYIYLAGSNYNQHSVPTSEGRNQYLVLPDQGRVQVFYIFLINRYFALRCEDIFIATT